MPFTSQAEKGFMFVHHPKIAKRWAKETPDMKDLPEYKMAKGGEVKLCPYCEGTGYATGGEADDPLETIEEGHEEDQEREGALTRRHEFARALKRGY